MAAREESQRPFHRAGRRTLGGVEIKRGGCRRTAWRQRQQQMPAPTEKTEPPREATRILRRREESLEFARGTHASPAWTWRKSVSSRASSSAGIAHGQLTTLRPMRSALGQVPAAY